MKDIETWFPEGKILTFTVNVTDTDKIIKFTHELNSPEKPISQSVGFELTSWSMQNVHEEILREKYITKLLAEDVLTSGNLYGVEVLRDNAIRSADSTNFTESVNLQLVDINVLHSRLERLKEIPVTDEAIEKLLKDIGNLKNA